MKHTLEDVEEKEVEFYVVSMEKAMDYAKHGKTEGTEIRQMIAMAGVIAKMRQTRGANRALDTMIARDRLGGLLPKQFQLENKA